jgi:hypothetical protein
MFSRRCLLRMPSPGYKNLVHTSQETLYFSASKFSHLMLCKIWISHGDDYEEWRPLGYKNRVRTSQETHDFSATVPSQLMLCKIWGFHSGDYERCRNSRMFRRVLRLPVTANFVPSSPIRVILMIKVIRFSETSVLTIPKRGNIKKDGIYRIHTTCFCVISNFQVYKFIFPSDLCM